MGLSRWQWPKLPDIATAPFCPSEVQGSIRVPKQSTAWQKFLIYLGPGLLVSVGYMDPGNWATAIEAGSRYGYTLLFVVLWSSIAAAFLQCLSMRVGMVTRRDLAQLGRERFSPRVNMGSWLLAELAIVATDVAEVLGGGLAFKLLFGCSLRTGILITALDTVIVLGLKGKGFRRVEAIVLGLVLTIGICFFTELWLIQPDWNEALAGLWPQVSRLHGLEPWYLALGILGATVMPHNLYLHSSIVHTREAGVGEAEVRQSLRFGTMDTVGSLALAFLVNAAILILAAAAFHSHGTGPVGIDEAYHLLDPLVGGSLGSLLFGIALLAAGQSSTFTGTIAGQVVMEGYLDLKIPCWQRRVITRALALVPAYIGVLCFGEESIGRLLVLSQVVLSLQLPFTIYPLIKFASDPKLMGVFRMRRTTAGFAWATFALITAANFILLYQLFT